MASAEGLPPGLDFRVDDGAELCTLEEARCDLVIASDAMVIIGNFGGIELWKASETQQRFGQYVRPALHHTRGKSA